MIAGQVDPIEAPGGRRTSVVDERLEGIDTFMATKLIEVDRHMIGE